MFLGVISEDEAGDGVMRGYEVRVHRGRALPPELHWIMAPSNEAAAEHAERLFVESLDAIGLEVMCDGARVHVRGIVPVATAPSGRSQRLDPEQRSRLWALMQRIERSRHRADMAEAKTAKGSEAFRAEMAEIAQEWRDLARHIETEHTASSVPAAPAGGEAAPSSPLVPTGPPARAGGLGRWAGVVVGMVIGALAALALAAPRWIEASTGVDIDRGSGALERGIAVIAPLAVIAVAFAAHAAPRSLLAKMGRQGS